MEHEIKVLVRGKIAVADRTMYICGNSDFVVAFDFDEEWKEYNSKTARFILGDGSYFDVIFKGNECPVPVISDTHSIKVGVYAGNLRTTTPAYISAKKSILCVGGVPAAPPDDVYAQIMEELKNLNSDIGEAVEKYLEENPIEGTEFETDETLILENETLGVNPEKVVLIERLSSAVDDALEQAKESGEFDGKDGADGVSPSVTVSKSGKVTTIKITDASGTKTATVNDGADGKDGADGYTPVKGKDYFDGAPGTPGKDGTSVTVSSVSESTADGGTNTVTFSDGKKINIKNGSKGKDGEKGDPGSDASVTAANIASALGYTPADAAEIGNIDAALDAILSIQNSYINGGGIA